MVAAQLINVKSTWQNGSVAMVPDLAQLRRPHMVG